MARSAAMLLLLGALLHAAHVHAGEGEDSNANDAGSNNKTAGAGKKDKKKKFNPNDSPLGPTVTTFYKTIKVDGIPGHTTYQLFSNSTLCKNCTNIFAFAGELPDLENPNRAMNMPPAWNIERTSNSVKSLGSQVGAVDKSHYTYDKAKQLAYDSWLTIGDKANHKPANIGTPPLHLLFDQWDDDHSLKITNGAIFFMDPVHGPKTRTTLIAQLTVKSDVAFIADGLISGMSNIPRNDGTGDTKEWESYARWSIGNNAQVVQKGDESGKSTKKSPEQIAKEAKIAREKAALDKLLGKAQAKNTYYAIARFTAAEGAADSLGIEGTIHFDQPVGGTALLLVNLTGMPPLTGPFPWHVHEHEAVAGKDCMATGGHYSPSGSSAAWNLAGRNQDLPNRKKVQEVYTDKVVQLSGTNSIIGRSIVIHGNKLTGGKRIACATILTEGQDRKIQAAKKKAKDGEGGHATLYIIIIVVLLLGCVGYLAMRRKKTGQSDENLTMSAYTDNKL